MTVLAADSPDVQTLSRQRAALSLAIGVLGIAWAAILVRWSGVSGMVSAFYRLAFAALVFVPWRLFAPRPSTRVTPAAKRAAIIAGVLFGADLALYNSAVMATNAANATLLGGNAPIFVALGGWLMYGERPTRRFWLGFLLALAGMIAIVGADVVLHPSLGLGDALAVTGAVCYGAYILFVRRSREGMDTLTFSAVSTAVGAACLIPVCLIAGQPLTGFSARSWSALVALALISQVIGQLFIAHALGKLPAALTSIVLLAQAPLTAALAWPLLGERIRPGQLLGGALVLAGIGVVSLSRAAVSRRSSGSDYRDKPSSSLDGNAARARTSSRRAASRRAP
ncbi:MAG TPA: EamA family transporter [Gemmatimonadaceae bacterium]